MVVEAHSHLLLRATNVIMKTNFGCNRWLSLAKPALKVAHVGTHRSSVARTSKCEWAISCR